MKKSYILLLLVSYLNFSTINLLAQRTFSTQGEQEDYWAVNLFKNKYSKLNFKRFDGKITELSGSRIKYDSTVLKVYTNSPAIKQIFTSGLFYPQIFADPRTVDTSIEKTTIYTTTTSQKRQLPTDSAELASYLHFQELFRNDTISVSIIEEVPFLSNSPTVKRFRMWVTHRWIHNPTIYFFELINDKATFNTDLSEFIKESSLTFVRKGWIII